MKFFRQLAGLVVLVSGFSVNAEIPTVTLTEEQTSALMETLQGQLSEAGGNAFLHLSQQVRAYVPSDMGAAARERRVQIGLELQIEIARLTRVLEGPEVADPVRRTHLSAVLVALLLGRALEAQRFPEPVVLNGTLDDFRELASRVYQVN